MFSTFLSLLSALIMFAAILAFIGIGVAIILDAFERADRK